MNQESGNLLGYRGQRAVVTGCASGIGAAVARLLLDLGAEVHGLDIALPSDPAHEVTRLDLSDPASIEAAVGRLGDRVDALFNCAGIPPGRAPVDVLKVNFIGTRELTRLVLPLVPAGGGIVNVSSNGGMGWPTRLATVLELLATSTYAEAVAWCEQRPDTVAEGYRFSKEAVTVWTQVASRDTIARGVRLNATSPGAVQTPMLEEIEQTTAPAAIDAVARPIGRRSTAAEQALPIVVLASRASSYVNGVVLPVDGGFAATVHTAPR